MENTDWKSTDKLVIASIIAVVEGVIVAKLVDLQGDCTPLVIPCWLYWLVLWAVFVLGTYFILIKGLWWVVTKLRKTSVKRKSTDPLNLELYPSKLDDAGYLDLVIQNNVKQKPFATINAAYIDHLEQPNYRSRVSRENNVEIKQGKIRTARFIKEETDGSFTIITYAEHSENPLYSFGIHKFEAMFVYGLGGSQNEFMKCFQIAVNYKKLHDFDIKIKPINCASRKKTSAFDFVEL